GLQAPAASGGPGGDLQIAPVVVESAGAPGAGAEPLQRPGAGVRRARPADRTRSARGGRRSDHLHRRACPGAPAARSARARSGLKSRAAGATGRPAARLARCGCKRAGATASGTKVLAVCRSVVIVPAAHAPIADLAANPPALHNTGGSRGRSTSAGDFAPSVIRP